MNDILRSLQQTAHRLRSMGVHFETDEKGCPIMMDWYNLSEKDLSGMSFHGRDLEKTKFQGSDLRNADFSHADIRKADFRGADMRGCNFGHANVWGADFRGAMLDEGAILEAANPEFAILQDGDIEHLRDVMRRYS